ncbi:MAG: hypothetical protein VKL59_22490 [Nostocaceae cyanobacterium]|nr:hypothetical protein [Nostocaceae cyanobacterium]
MSFPQIRLVVLFVLLLPVLLACNTPMSFANPNNGNVANQSDTQGIQGSVVRLSGNQMPTIGVPRSQNPPQPVQTTVWVFSGRINSDASPFWSVNQAQKHPHLRQKVQTNPQGQFSVNLPPGEYTLFAQYGDNLYLNSFLGDGSFSTVQVTPNKMTETQLVHTEDAAF